MPSPLPITGVGLVSPLGRTAADTWSALLGGRHITDHTRLEPVERLHLPRVSSLAIESAQQAVTQARWTAGSDIAIVACTSKGPIEEWIRPAVGPTSDYLGGGDLSKDRCYGMGSLSGDIAAALRAGEGPRLTLSAACAGGLQALIRGALLILNGEAERVLVVAAEASVHPLFLASFRRLGVLPPPGELCRPFDVHRRGFLMSEAAAAICLESPTLTGPRLAAVDRFATGADAVSLTGSDPEAEALGRLIAAVSTDCPFDLVHAHGTATGLNDAAELTAFARHLSNGGAGTSLYSHKAALGHTLGASGLVSAVLNVMAHTSSQIPPNVNTRSPMPTALGLPRVVERRRITHSLACAAGFGGGISAVSFSN